MCKQYKGPCNQKDSDTVDEYAQELRALFKKAFPKLERDSEEEGESILTLRLHSGATYRAEEVNVGSL